MAFWLCHISDEFKNQKNFSYFNNPFPFKIRSDLNTQAPEYHSPKKTLNPPISLDFMDTVEDYKENQIQSPRSEIQSPRSEIQSPRSDIQSPQKSPKSPKSPNIKVYHNKKYKNFQKKK
jgi:hypothetical protein